MDKQTIANAIKLVGSKFTKIDITNIVDLFGFPTVIEVTGADFYASLQAYKDSTETNIPAGTLYINKSYLYVSELEIDLSEGDRFKDARGHIWLAKNIIDDYRELAGYTKWLVERVIL